MTQEIIDSGGDNSLSQDVSQDTNVSQTQVETASEQNKQVSKEKYVPASYMNDIVNKRTKEASQNAYDRAKRELEEQYKKPQETSHSIGGIQQQSEEQIRQLMRDEYQKMQAQQHEEWKKQNLQEQINNLANDFMGKISSANDAYPDLAKRVDEIGDLDQLIYYINETDAVPGIVDDLLNNGHKVAALFTLADKSPAMLRKELKKMADSIKNNESAKNRPHINEPLRQPTYSNNTLDSGSTSNIEALKNDSFYRG